MPKAPPKRIVQIRAELELTSAILPRIRLYANALSRKCPAHVTSDDLYSAGVLGAVEAAKRHRLQGGSSFRAFVLVRSHGAMIDYLRATDNRSRGTAKREVRGEIIAAPIVPEKENPTPEAILARVETRDAIDRVIWRLPKKYRLLIYLRYFDSLSIKSIARILRLNPISVSRLHTKAIEILRKELGNENDYGEIAAYLIDPKKRG